MTAMPTASTVFDGFSHQASRASYSTCTPHTVALSPALDKSAYPLLSREHANADLTQLTQFIAERSSYALSVSFPYRTVLDSVRATLPDTVQVEQIALLTQKILQEIGDAHGRLVNIEQYIPAVFSPVCFGRVGRLCFAYDPVQRELLDPLYPYVHSIDGLPIDSWLACADALSAGTYGSSSSKTLRGFLFMRYIGLLRNELGLPQRDILRISLRNTNDDALVEHQVSLSEQLITPPAPLNLPKESRMLDNNIAYLRIYSQHDDALPPLIHANMARFRDSRALIIDARQCGGGVRDNLLALFPYFMAPNSAPYIANVCKLRIPKGQEPEFNPIGQLDTWDKKVPYRHDPMVAAKDIAALEQFLSTFQPVWEPPPKAFSDWYFMALRPDSQKYYYDKPVYLMVDWGVGSAGDIFSSSFKDWGNIQLVGMPTNGRSGNAITFTLPHSQVSFMLSTMASFQKDGQLYEGTGVSPDYHLAHTIQDWLGHTDSQLERTQLLIQQQLDV